MLTVAETQSGQIIRIGSLGGIPKRDRPDCYCVGCAGRLTAKLGTRNLHHFAHRPPSSCPASGGEGELHLEAKLQLHLALVDLAAEGGILQRKGQCQRCGATIPIELIRLEPGDRVEFERGIQGYRPDVSIFRASRPLAAFELVVSNACSPEKWRDLCELFVVTVEVRAADALEWVASRSCGAAGLLALLASSCAVSAVCSCCLAEEDRLRRLPKCTTVVDRWIDVRHCDGTRATKRFRVRKWRREEKVFRAEILIGSRVVRTFEGDGAIEMEKALDASREFYRHQRASMRRSTADAISEWCERDGIPEDADVWWVPSERRWARGYSWEELRDILGIRRYTTLAKWYREGKLRWFIGQRAADTRREHLYDAEAIDRLRRWLEQRRDVSR